MRVGPNVTVAAQRPAGGGVSRPALLTVPGVGDGAPGRRSRARNRSGAVVAATADPHPGYGVHLFGDRAGRRRAVSATPGRLRVGSPTTCAARSAKGAKATW